jgi:hypothetical protein
LDTLITPFLSFSLAKGDARLEFPGTVQSLHSLKKQAVSPGFVNLELLNSPIVPGIYGPWGEKPSRFGENRREWSDCTLLGLGVCAHAHPTARSLLNPRKFIIAAGGTLW